MTHTQNRENQSPYTVLEFLTLITQNCTQEKSSGCEKFPKTQLRSECLTKIFSLITVLQCKIHHLNQKKQQTYHTYIQKLTINFYITVIIHILQTIPTPNMSQRLTFKLRTPDLKGQKCIQLDSSLEHLYFKKLNFYIHLNPKIYTVVHSVMALRGLNPQIRQLDPFKSLFQSGTSAQLLNPHTEQVCIYIF